MEMTLENIRRLVRKMAELNFQMTKAMEKNGFTDLADRCKGEWIACESVCVALASQESFDEFCRIHEITPEN